MAAATQHHIDTLEAQAEEIAQASISLTAAAIAYDRSPTASKLAMLEDAKLKLRNALLQLALPW